MERTITYRLHVWLSSILDTNYYIQALGGGDMYDVVEMEDGVVLRVD